MRTRRADTACLFPINCCERLSLSTVCSLHDSAAVRVCLPEPPSISPLSLAEAAPPANLLRLSEVIGRD
jgi:hypothetical protein